MLVRVVGSVALTLFFARCFFTTSAVTPPAEVAPMAISVTVVVHAEPIDLLRSRHPPVAATAA
ncbi:MAG: hypothetical protein ACRERE_37285 [Candidatus Entotheonellia bacterium]